MPYISENNRLIETIPQSDDDKLKHPFNAKK